MASSTTMPRRPRPMNIHVARGSRAEHKYRALAGIPDLLPEALAPGIPPTPAHDLLYHGGKTIPNLTFTNFYVAGDSWQASDIQNIDRALAAAMSEPTLNNVMAQYFNAVPTSRFVASQKLPGPVPAHMSQGDVEQLVRDLHTQGKLTGDLGSTVFNFMLPRGTVLNDNPAPGAAEGVHRAESHRRFVPEEEEADSLNGLGGYHGSVQFGGTSVYYAVGVYSETANGKTNGIPVFDAPWKNVVATLYHGLNEARTNPDVAQVVNGGPVSLLGWCSRHGEECGDFPVFEAHPLSEVFQEVPITGGGTAPVQFQYSDFVHGPEGPVTTPRPPAKQKAHLSDIQWETPVTARRRIDADTPDASASMARTPYTPGSAAELDKAEYLVWFGTNRRPNDPNDASKGYSAARDTVVHHGSCRVYVPRSHKIGSVGSPFWKRLLTMTDDRLRLLAISELADDAYWSGIATHLASVNTDERCALIFVHGYNVTFQDAALRAAQIGFDLSIKGTTAFFSWPSRGSPVGYPADEETIGASEGAIADFMTEFADRSGANAVHVIAHSMGNRGVLRAVNRIATTAGQRSGKPFGQIMLAAADVDADLFRQLSAAYAEVAGRTTLYVSKHDRAIEASRWLHGYPRAGLMPPTLVLPGIDTINVTNVDLTMLGHGYIAAARDVLSDMHALIRRDSPPYERFGLREAINERGERFWLIGA